MTNEPGSADLKMDPGGLFREEIFTDGRMGSIRVLTPVKVDGSLDAARKVIYMGEAQMLTPGGVLPLSFGIEAASLRDAVEQFAAAARTAVEHTIEELQQLRREASSSIIVPETMPSALRHPGGPRGGGKIQLP